MLPDGLEAVGATSRNVGNIPSGGSADASFTVRPSSGGTYTASIRVTSDNTEPVECASITTSVCAPSISIDLSGTNRWYMGNPGVFTAVVSNTGSCDAAGVRVNADLGANLRYISSTEGGTGSGSSANWNLGTLKAGESRTLEFRVDGTRIAEGNITVAAKGDCAAEVRDSEPTDVQGIPAILLEVIDVTDPVRVGESTTYVITATNQGSAVGTNIRIEASVEDMTITGTSGATDGSVSGKNVTFASLASLAPGAKAEWRVTVRVDEAGDQRFSVTMNSDQLKRPVNETEATNCYE